MIEVLPNQTLKIIENGETVNEMNARKMWDGREYCQLIKTSQTQQWQLKVTEDSGNNVMANGDFTLNLNSWTQNIAGAFLPVAGVATLDNNVVGVAQNGILSQPLTLLSRTYKLTFDVHWRASVGETQLVTVIMTNTTSLGGDAWVQQNPVDGIFVSTYTMYFRPNSAPNEIRFILYSDDAGGSLEHGLDNVRLVELTEPVLALYDCNGNYIQDINTVQRFEDYITYTHSWENQVDGTCYKICILGLNDLALNHVEGSFCLLNGRGLPLLDENGNCIQFEIT